MFKCDYNLNGECQLYNEDCRSDKTRNCKLYMQCHSCRYKMLPCDAVQCVRCKSVISKANR